MHDSQFLRATRAPAYIHTGAKLSVAAQRRLVALQKPNGRGVRALVVGDALRRLVGRTLAQAFAPHFEQACLPHLYGLSTHAGSEALPRVFRAAAEVDARATVLSVDAVGAFDHVSRQGDARRAPGLASAASAPSLRLAVLRHTQFLRLGIDAQGVTHHIAQANGGEQGDPLMPALCSLAQQPALEEVQSQLRGGEALFAYLDDTYVVCTPERACELYKVYRRALWAHARVELNRSKHAFGMPPGRSLLASPRCKQTRTPPFG